MDEKKHFSERFGRNFEPGDWLYAAEALDVLAANAGRRVSESNLTKLKDGRVRSKLLSERRRVYLYDDLRDVEIAPTSGPRRDESLSDRANVRAQRAFRERERAQKEREKQEKLRQL